MTFRTFNKKVEGKKGLPTILNTLTECAVKVIARAKLSDFSYF